MKIEALQWLAGYWIGEHGGGRLEECWLAPRGGTLVGLSRITTAEKTVHKEFMTLEQSNEDLLLTLTVATSKTIRMRAIEASTDKIVYADTSYDPPDRLTYERGPGETLDITLEKMRDGQAKRERFHLQRGVALPS